MSKYTLTILAAIVMLSSAMPAVSQVVPSSGTVTILYELKRYPHVASNQIAVWIEDANGENVRTLYISDYTGGDVRAGRPGP